MRMHRICVPSESVCLRKKVSQGIAASDKVQLEDMDLCWRVQQVLPLCPPVVGCSVFLPFISWTCCSTSYHKCSY